MMIIQEFQLKSICEDVANADQPPTVEEVEKRMSQWFLQLMSGSGGGAGFPRGMKFPGM
jgi:hypothetical protein